MLFLFLTCSILSSPKTFRHLPPTPTPTPPPPLPPLPPPLHSTRRQAGLWGAITLSLCNYLPPPSLFLFFPRLLFLTPTPPHPPKEMLVQLSSEKERKREKISHGLSTRLLLLRLPWVKKSCCVSLFCVVQCK